MRETTPTSENKSCSWLNKCYCCWHQAAILILIFVLLGGLFWQEKRLSHEIQQVDEKMQKGTPGQLKTQVDTISQLIQMANIQVKTFGEKNQALDYLQQATLQTQALPPSETRDALVKALTTDSQSLSNVETVSLTTVSYRINALIRQADQLVIGKIQSDIIPAPNASSEAMPASDQETTPTAADTTVTVSPAPSTAPASKPQMTAVNATTTAATDTSTPEQSQTWQDKLKSGWTHLKALVHIESKGTSDNVIEAWLIPAKLTLQLEELKLAAFYRDNRLFHQLADETNQWITNHYDVSKEEQVRNILVELNNMKSWVLNPNHKILQGSMTALDNLKQAMANNT